MVSDNSRKIVNIDLVEDKVTKKVYVGNGKGTKIRTYDKARKTVDIDTIKGEVT